MPALPGTLALTSIADGSNIVAADHRNNYLAIQTAVNALKDALSGGSAGQVLQAASSSSVQYGGGAAKYSTLVDIVSSVTETDILQAAGVTIAANALGANGDARVILHGDYLNNTGGTTTLRLKVYWDGVAVIDTNVSFAVSASAVRRTFRLELLLSNLGATNAQFISGLGVLGGATIGSGGFDKLDATGNDGQYIDIASNGTHAVDTTLAKVLRVTATLGSSAATHELRVRKSLVEII